MNKLDVYDISIEELVCLLSSFFMYLSPTALFSLISLVLFTFLCFHTCTFICDVLLPCSFIPYQDLWAFGLLSFLSHLQVKTATNSSVFPFSLLLFFFFIIIFYMGFFWPMLPALSLHIPAVPIAHKGSFLMTGKT